MTYQTTNQITGKRKWWALATVLLTMFFASMDQTVVSTATPTIINDLKGFNLYAWVFSSYMITSAVTVPIYGKLSDVYGRRPFYLFGLIVFLLGSIISAFSVNMWMFIIARAFQGIGAGAMMSMPRATVGDIFNPKERGKWMGVIGSVFGLSSIIGPTVGGWITDNLGWEWIFFINLPFAIIAILGVIYVLPKVKTEHRVKVDWLGSVLLTVGLVPILLGFTWAGDKYAWTDPVEIFLFGGGVLVLLIFALFERRVKEPIVETSLFTNRLFTTTSILGIFVSMGMFGGPNVSPIIYSGVIGLSVENSGLVMSPMMLSFIGGSMVSGMVMSRTGKYKRIAYVGSLLMVAGYYFLSQMTVETAYPRVIVNMIVLGIGIGSIMPLLNVAVQNAFPYRMMGTVNATQQFVRSLGGVIAAPIFGSLLNKGFQAKFEATLPSQIAEKFSGINPQTLLTKEAQDKIAGNFASYGETGNVLYHQFVEAVKISLTSGIHELFIVGLGFAVLAFIGTFFLPELDLKGDEYFKQEGEQTGE